MQAWERDRSLSGIFMVEADQKERVQKWIYFLEEIRAKAAMEIGLQAISDHRLLVRVGATQGERISFQAKVSNGKLDFYLQVSDSIDRAELLRALSRVFIYERILPKEKVWKNGEILPVIPFWIVEGLTQSLDPSLFELEVVDQIIRRMRSLEKFPTLQQVMSWEELSEQKVEGYFQRSFCYALYAWNFKGESSLEKGWSMLGEDLKGWLVGDQEEMQARWSRYLKDFKAQKEFFMSWEETEKAVAKVMVFQIPNGSGEEEKVQTLSWDCLREGKDSREFLEKISERQGELLVLETQIHFAWRSFLFHYRTALQLLANELQPSLDRKSHFSSRSVNSMALSPPSKKVTYEEIIALAKQELSGLKQRSLKTTEYLDWFLVNYSSSQEKFSFEDYFQEANQRKESPFHGKDPYRSQGIRVEQLNEQW